MPPEATCRIAMTSRTPVHQLRSTVAGLPCIVMTRSPSTTSSMSLYVASALRIRAPAAPPPQPGGGLAGHLFAPVAFAHVLDVFVGGVCHEDPRPGREAARSH